MSIPIVSADSIRVRPPFGHSSNFTEIMYETTLRIRTPAIFLPFFSTTISLEQSFIGMIPQFDTETLEEILRVAAAARLTR